MQRRTNPVGLESAAEKQQEYGAPSKPARSDTFFISAGAFRASRGVIGSWLDVRPPCSPFGAPGLCGESAPIASPMVVPNGRVLWARRSTTTWPVTLPEPLRTSSNSATNQVTEELESAGRGNQGSCRVKSTVLGVALLVVVHCTVPVTSAPYSPSFVSLLTPSLWPCFFRRALQLLERRHLR